MSWRPERGWFSLGARVVVAAGGALVLAAGLTTVPSPFVPDSPTDSTVTRLGPDRARASRPLIRQEPTRVGERDAAATAGAGEEPSRIDGQASEGSLATTDRSGGTTNEVAPTAPSTGGVPESSSGSSGGSAPSDPDHSGSDDPVVPESSGEGSDDPDDTSPDDTDTDGGDSPDVSGGDSDNGDDDER